MELHEPLMSIWFGNFYCPAYDDVDFIDRSMEKIKELGFNTVELDSKDWQDFRDAFAGKEESPYVRMQRYMRDSAHEKGLAHMFLALYLNGDNLYPRIRYSPPVYGESVTNPDGSDGRWYRYWSERSRQTQTDHVQQLLEHGSEGEAELVLNGKKCIPICSMWDPIAAPSFDADGISRYIGWLQARYGHIDHFNAAYGTSFSDFQELTPSDYWFSVRYGEGTLYSPEDLIHRSPRFTLWADNMRWKADELSEYFEAMQKKLHSINPDLFLMPNLSQWSHFLNIDTSAMPDVGLCDLWDTANRGIDMRRISPFVDMAHWFTLPVTMDGEPDAYVVSCQHAYMRSLNHGREWIGGVYWGRFLYNDIYRFISPEEIIGSIVGSGAHGIAAYGWCGLDDGGVLHRMDDGFLDSLKRGNHWAKEIIPQTGARLQSSVAILFPSDMALLEPLGVKGAAERRTDLLGLYRFCCDHGYAPDLVDAEDVKKGLSGYKILLIPANDCYHTQRDFELEQALSSFVKKGGVVIHSSSAEQAEYAFGLVKKEVKDTCYSYQEEGGLLNPELFSSFEGKTLASWLTTGENCVSENSFGKGRVISFGFMPGFQYAARKNPHVPSTQGNHELYPFSHMTHNILKDSLNRACKPECPVELRDVECVPFENGWIVINHRSTPVTLPFESSIMGQQSDTCMLPGHSSTFCHTS